MAQLGAWSTYFYYSGTGTPAILDYRCRYVLNYTQDLTTAITTISVQHYVQYYSEGAYSEPVPAITSTVTINGVSHSLSKAAQTRTFAVGYQNVLIGTTTYQIQHDYEGKATCQFSAVARIGTRNRPCSHTWALPDISLASTFTSDVSEQTLGNDIVFTITPKEPTYIHVLKYKYGTSGEEEIASNIIDNYTWATPINMSQYITDNTYGTATIYCHSYDGTISDENYKGYSKINIKLNIPSSVIPTGTLAVTDINTTSTSEPNKVPSSWGILVKGYSRLQLQATPVMAYGATLQSILITACDGQSGNTNPFTSPLNVQTSGNGLNNTCLITDSRGRTNTISTTSNIYDYQNPNVVLNVVRADGNGDYDANGENAKITINYQITSLNNNNLKHYVLKYRAKGTSTYTTLRDVDLTNYTDTLTIITTGDIFDAGTTYEFLIQINDQFNITEANATLSYSNKPISCKKTTGITFGRHALDDGFNVYYDADFKMNLSKNGNPIYGAITLFDDANGNNGSVQLSDISDNYISIEIYAKDNVGHKGIYIKIEKLSDGDVFTLSSVDATSTTTITRRTKYTVSGDTLVPSNGGYTTVSGSSISSILGTNYIYITKVIGYK